MIKKKAAKKTVAKKAVKKVAKKKVVKKAKTKRKPNAAFMKPMKISSALALVVGDKPIPRTEVTKNSGSTSRRTGSRTKSTEG